MTFSVLFDHRSTGLEDMHTEVGLWVQPVSSVELSVSLATSARGILTDGHGCMCPAPPYLVSLA